MKTNDQFIKELRGIIKEEVGDIKKDITNHISTRLKKLEVNSKQHTEILVGIRDALRERGIMK